MPIKCIGRIKRTELPTVDVGNTDVRYPHLVEYGTTHSAAQPYFWPAVRANNKRIKLRIARAIRKAVRETGGG